MLQDGQRDTQLQDAYRTTRRGAARASLVLLGAAAVVATASGAAWAATSVSGSPSTALKDGTAIAVTGTGFGSGTALFIVQCSGTTAESCDTARLASTTSDANGNVAASFTVHTGAIGDGTCAAGSTNCIVAVTDLAKQYVGFFPLSFAPASTPSPTSSPSPTKKPTGSHVTGGSGSTGGSGTTTGSGSGSGASSPTSVAAGSGGEAGREGPNVALALGLAVAGATAAAGTVRLHRRRGVVGA